MKFSEELALRKLNASAPPLAGSLMAVLACGAVTLVALPLRGLLNPANLLVLYLLPVLLVSARRGWMYGMLAAFLGVLAFDVFLVPPYYSLRVEDSQYLVSFAMLLGVALVVGRLTAQLKEEALAAAVREARTQALFDLARELLAANDGVAVEQAAARHGRQLWNCAAHLLTADEQGKLSSAGALPLPASVVAGAQALFDAASHGKALPEISRLADACLIRLRDDKQLRGIMVLTPDHPGGAAPATDAFLGAWAALICLALDRIRFASLAQQAATATANERLRNAILAAVSHDLRTPLAALIGLTGALQAQPGLDANQADLCRAIEDEALRMDDMAGNLLQLARLSSGAPLDAQLQMLEESLGPALAHMQRPLAQHQLEVRMEEGLPLLRFDAVLIERVLCNLLSNAARHAPPGSRILLVARAVQAGVEVCVQDEGPGMSEAALSRLQREHEAPGAGLGLWICQRILGAHGASLQALAAETGGMRFCFTLPGDPGQQGVPA